MCKQTKQVNWSSFVLPSIVIIALITLFIVRSFFQTAWADEVFTMGLIRHSYLDVIKLDAMDVHPPLYYLILKPFVDVFGGHSVLQQMFVARLVSIIPIGLIVFVMNNEIKKMNISLATRLWLSVIFLSLPNMFHFAVEIRMYAWGALFVFAAYLCGVKILTNTNLKMNYLGLSLFSIFAAYTHYFCAIAVAMILAYLFGYYLIKRQFIYMLRPVLAGVAILIGYLPWLLIVISQVTTVKGSYWIAPITAFNVLTFIIAPFKDPGDDFNKYLTVFVGLVLLGLFALILVKSRKQLQARINDLFIANQALLLSLFIFFGTIVFGVTVSILMRPVMVGRYLFPTLPGVWFGIYVFFLKGFNNQKWARPQMLKFGLPSLAILMMLVSTFSIIKHDIPFEMKNRAELVKLISKVDANEGVKFNVGARAANDSKTVETQIEDDMAVYVSKPVYFDNVRLAMRQKAQTELKAGINPNIKMYKPAKGAKLVQLKVVRNEKQIKSSSIVVTIQGVKLIVE
ncbi:MAG: hypothetical protein LBT80_01220 [Lactobacillaceae bacterium]|jgi:hypothetical protein|nr:hypothetical protein [Lactobacillaceae bacterium]